MHFRLIDGASNDIILNGLNENRLVKTDTDYYVEGKKFYDSLQEN